MEKAKFLAFTGLAISRDCGDSFQRVGTTPVLDRCSDGPFIGALHSIARLPDGSFRAWISRGDGWEAIGERLYPRYDCWTLTSNDGVTFDNAAAQRIITPSGDEYRIGRPRATQLEDGTWELRATSDTRAKQYAAFRFTSPDGVEFTRTDDVELPLGPPGSWDREMTCCPTQFVAPDGGQHLYYNFTDMGLTGIGLSEWQTA